MAIALFRRVAATIVAAARGLVAAVTLEIVVVIALPIDEALVGEGENARRKRGYQVAIMRCHEGRTLVLREAIAERDD